MEILRCADSAQNDVKCYGWRIRESPFSVILSAAKDLLPQEFGVREPGIFTIAAQLSEMNARAQETGPNGPVGARLALARAGVQPSKSKGQNFLVQPAIADRIVEAAALRPGDT